MRIAFIANTSWYLYNLRLGIIKFLLEKSILITIISSKDQYTAKLIAEGCHFVHVKIDDRGTNPLSDLYFSYQLSKIFKQNTFDYVFTYTVKPNIYGSIASSLSKQKVITILSGRGHSMMNTNLLSKGVKKLYQLAASKSTEMWFVNEDDYNFFIEEKIVEPEKCRVLSGEGIDVKHFQPQLSKRTSNKINFLFSGRLIWSKGLKYYIEAAQYITQKYTYTQFNILGFFLWNNPDAITEEEVQRWHEKKIISYLGSTTDVRPYLAQTDCFVLPSFYGEGTPRSLLEAASMAIPIITTDNVGCREVVDDRINGFLCEPKSSQDLIEKIEEFLRLVDDDRRIMGRAGRKKVKEQFREELVINHYAELLNLPKLPVCAKMTTNYKGLKISEI